MKITGIKASNFKGIDQIDVEFSDGHTSIIGLNGSGKTSLVDVIRACLKGVSQKSSNGELVGERFRFIGPNAKTSNLCVSLRDEKNGFDVEITNKMSKASNGIDFKASDGRPLDRQWLNDFFNVAFLSAKNFVESTPKEQTLLLGINTSKFDDALYNLKSEFTIINRAVKDFGEVAVCDKVDRVDTYLLGQEKDRIFEHNRLQDERKQDIEQHGSEVSRQQDRVTELQEQLKRSTNELLRLSKVFKEDLPNPEEKIDVSNVINQTANADETNRLAEMYERSQEMLIAKESKVKELNDNKSKQDAISDKRIKYIRTFDFKNAGLSVDENGGLLLDDRRLNTYSKGEQEVIVANLYASQDPKLKVRIIDEFQSLDAPNQDKIVKGLIDKGFQVITMEVGDKKKGKDTILLRECAVVGDENKDVQSNKPSLF